MLYQLSYSRLVQISDSILAVDQREIGVCEASCGIRTHDLPLTKRMLYQLS